MGLRGPLEVLGARRTQQILRSVSGQGRTMVERIVVERAVTSLVKELISPSALAIMSSRGSTPWQAATLSLNAKPRSPDPRTRARARARARISFASSPPPRLQEARHPRMPFCVLVL